MPKSIRPCRVRRPSYEPSDLKAVMDLRREHPFMGKAPIQRMLERKGLRLGVSIVGKEFRAICPLSGFIAARHRPGPNRGATASPRAGCIAACSAKTPLRCAEPAERVAYPLDTACCHRSPG